MYEGKKAELEMKKAILAGGIWESKVFQCKILAYHAEEERVYLLLEDDSLADIVLDAVYECRIETGTTWHGSEGRIKERYYNEHGKINSKIYTDHPILYDRFDSVYFHHQPFFARIYVSAPYRSERSFNRNDRGRASYDRRCKTE